ncbi:MAG: dynamin family protein [Cyanobacteria bacterium P01_C01_bin.118]
MAILPSLDNIIPPLQKAVGLLEPDNTELKTNILRQCAHLTHPNLRIIVFGPFNHGKSTLLNALLGQKALPIDLVPTTGAAITITYGTTITTRITLIDGTSIKEPSTELLKRYATLNDQRQMQQNVRAVQVQCPHPLLQQGVELVDLPGTDDQDDNSQLIYSQLLEADVVVQLLDGRKLMTLAERNHLRDWLISRGITTVVFVVNFLNLVETEERQQVMDRLHAITEDFCTPVSNLYAVDALPALRARLKEDTDAANASGLPALESALHTLAQTLLPQLPQHRLSRLLPLVRQVHQALEQQLQVLEQTPLPRRAAIQKRVQQLMKTGFEQSVTDLKTWLQIDNLLAYYQQDFSLALQGGNASQWLTKTLYPTWEQKRRAVVEWGYKVCDFAEKPRPVDLWVGWQQAPKEFSQPEQELIRSYLVEFSRVALAALDTYQSKVSVVLQTPVQLGKTSTEQTAKKLLLRNTLVELQELQEDLK